MKNILFLIVALLTLTLSSFGQGLKGSNPPAKPSSFEAENARAKLAFAAHGGDKLRALRSLVIRGSVDTTLSAFPQSMPGGFSMVISGEKYRLDIQNAMQSFKQIYDGRETFCSIRGFTLPPLTSMGLPLLQRLGMQGYTVSNTAATNKKKNGFRITAPDGAYTDFYLDQKTNQISSYESSFEVNGNIVTTAVEVDRYALVDGVSVPEKFAQRFDLGQLTAYAQFKAKEILINKELDDGVFAIGK